MNHEKDICLKDIELKQKGREHNLTQCQLGTYALGNSQIFLPLYVSVIHTSNNFRKLYSTSIYVWFANKF